MGAFSGDGRLTVQPVNSPPGLRPRAVRVSVARLLIKKWEETGRSVHTSAGSTVWVLVTHCLENNIDYVLTNSDSFGLRVERREGKEVKIVPCKWCSNPTNMLGTKMCNGCWELDHRIRMDPLIAERIVKYYKQRRKEEGIDKRRKKVDRG